MAERTQRKRPAADDGATASAGAREPAPDGPPPGERQPGEILAGRYRLGQRLGRGGMGSVHEASDLALEVQVALKIVRPDLARNEAMLRRFKREVLLARSVTHRQVCRIYDFGRHEDGRGSTDFITMELLRGESLKARILARSGLPTAEALPLVRQMAAGLEAAHRSGIVHRDFKSSNVMVVLSAGGERAVVTDFGLAGLSGPGVAGESAAERRLGTPAYMAPEQVRGEPTTPAADIYALGVVLFEMVTGELPFHASDRSALARLRLTEDPPSPRRLRPELDQRWEAAILRCLRREPGERFAQVEEVVEALEGGGATVAARWPALPAERNRFVGREDDRRILERHFTAGARLVTLVGPGGMGKTRLAIHHGRLAGPSFPGGVWFTSLSEARSLEGVAAAVSGALEVPLGRGDPVAEIGHAIAGRGRALLILDNFEQVAGHAPDTLGRWLERAPEARFLVTSRERLRLEGEVVHPLEPLPPAEGIELFADRVRAVRPGFALDPATSADVRRVVDLLEGLPLALELAAARTAVLAPAHLVELMQDRFRLLARRGEPGRHGSLRAAIDDSWDMLRPWEKAAFARASVFEGGFTLEAAEQVLGAGDDPDAPWVVDVLQALVDKSLVRTWVPEGSYGEPRFGMYASLQEYAREKLAADDGVAPGWQGGRELARALERHGRHYAGFGGEAARESLHAHGGAGRLRALGREIENLMAAIGRAVARADGDTAARSLGAAWEILELRGPVGAMVDLGEAVVAMDGLDDAGRLRALRDLGRACWRAGQVEPARERLERALAMARRLGDRRFEGVVLGDLATYHMSLGQLREASERFDGALALHREAGNRVHEGIALGNLGVLMAAQGDAEAARQCFEQALDIHREVGNRLFEGVVLGNLGSLHGGQGRSEESRRSSEGALAIYRELGARRAEGTVLANLGILDRNQGRAEQAFERFEQALEIHRSVGNRHGEGVVIGYLGLLHLHGGRLEPARERLAEAERLLREARDVVELGKLLCGRGLVEAQAGDRARALACLDEARALAAACGAAPESELGRALGVLAAGLA